MPCTKDILHRIPEAKIKVSRDVDNLDSTFLFQPCVMTWVVYTAYLYARIEQVGINNRFVLCDKSATLRPCLFVVTLVLSHSI